MFASQEAAFRSTMKMFACALAGALAISFAMPASAHGPTRQKVTETIEINVSPDKVWAVIRDFQDKTWHPAVSKTDGTGGNDAGALRTLTLTGGGVIEESLSKHDDKAMLYKYRIEKVDVAVLPVNNYSSTLSVEGGEGKSTVTWRGAFYRGYMNNDPPEDLNDAAAIKAVTGIYQAGLNALKEKLEAGG